MPEVDIQKIKFLGATVESMDCNFGFNGNPSSLTVSLVEDLDVGSNETPDDFAADSFDDSDLDGHLMSGMGGSEFSEGNPGTFATLDLTEFGDFKFSGFVTSWRRTNSSSGRKISAQLKDPRMILSKIPIVINADLSSMYGFDYSAINAASHNVIDVYGVYGNVVDADWTNEGASARKIMDAISFTDSDGNQKSFQFYNQNFTISFSQPDNSGGIPEVSGKTSWVALRVPLNYRVPLQDTTISNFINKVAEQNNFDWYVTTDTISPGNHNITIHAIPRSNHSNLVFSSETEGDNHHPVHKFLSERKERLVSFDTGRELRDEPNDVILIGDNRRSFHATQESPGFGGRAVFPIFSRSKDDHFFDKMFIPLDSIQTTNDTTMISELPFVYEEKKELKSGNPVGDFYDPATNLTFIPSSSYTRSRPYKSKPGYLATEEILRAALYSKEAWSTAVWYYYYDLGLAGATIPYYAFATYDDGVFGRPKPLGRVAGNQHNYINVQSGIPEGMGIYSPDYRRDAENPFKSRTALASSLVFMNYRTEGKQAIKEACFRATLKFAEEYYGKVFMCGLPYSPLFDGILSPGGFCSYSTNDNSAVSTEYETTDAAPPLTHPSDVSEVTIPYHIAAGDSRGFISNKGMLKPVVAINHGSITNNNASWHYSFPAYAYASYDKFSASKSAKISLSVPNYMDHAENLWSNFEFWTSDVSVEQYRWDPRFAVVKLSKPIELGYGHIRGVFIKYNHGHDEINRGETLSGYATLEWATQPSEKDVSGAFQSFISWLYRKFTIIPNLKNNSGMKVNIIDSGSNKRIDASFYKQLLYTESKNTEKVGFAQRRYIGLYQTFNSGDYSPTCPELHSQGVGDLGFLSANAMTFLIPLKWKNLYYGPFSWESEDREEGSNIIPNDTGPTSIVRNKTLNPWNYGNFDRMARAAKILSNNAQSYTSTTSFVNAEIEGYPEISLGHSLTGNVDGPNHDGSLYEVVSSLAGVTLGLSMSGITTKYRFKTYFGLVGTQLKEELDQISRGEADQDRSDKDIIKLDEIRKNLEKDEGSGEDSGEDVDRSNPYQSLAGHADAIVMTRATGQTDSRSLVTMIARSEIEEAKESRPDLSGAWNVGFDDTYVMGLSELYSACATNHQLDCEGFVPSINGIPIA